MLAQVRRWMTGECGGELREHPAVRLGERIPINDVWKVSACPETGRVGISASGAWGLHSGCLYFPPEHEFDKAAALLREMFTVISAWKGGSGDSRGWYCYTTARSEPARVLPVDLAERKARWASQRG